MVLKKITHMNNEDCSNDHKISNEVAHEMEINPSLLATENETAESFDEENHLQLSKKEGVADNNDPSSIIGYKNKIKKKKGKKVNKENEINIDAKVSQVIFVIGELIKPGKEFFTTEINEELRQKGFSNSDISGQLYALKQNGTLSNRLPETIEEQDLFQKNVRIWRASDNFWSRYEKLINEKNRQETNINKLDGLGDKE